MAQTMGQIIKRLRKERNFTQDELAEQLNISAAAISKWENDTSMPDISQIVPLANIFGVNTDVLFGMFEINNDKEIEKIINEVFEPIKTAYTYEATFHAYENRYFKLLETLQKYPNNIPLLSDTLACGVNLLYYYIRQNDKSNIQKVYFESERQAKLIINYSKEIGIICDAYEWLVSLYLKMEMFDKAKECAETLPFYVRKPKLAVIYDEQGNNEAAIKERCHYFDLLLREFDRQIFNLGNNYMNKEQYQDAIDTYESIFGIIKAIYGTAEYTPPMLIDTYYHVQLAICYLKLGDEDSALTWLEKMYDYYLCIQENFNKVVKLETPILCEHEYNFVKHEFHAKDSIYLHWKVFDSIRDSTRFKTLADKVNAL